MTVDRRKARGTLLTWLLDKTAQTEHFLQLKTKYSSQLRHKFSPRQAMEQRLSDSWPKQRHLCNPPAQYALHIAQTGSPPPVTNQSRLSERALKSCIVCPTHCVQSKGEHGKRFSLFTIGCDQRFKSFGVSRRHRRSPLSSIASDQGLNIGSIDLLPFHPSPRTRNPMLCGG